MTEQKYIGVKTVVGAPQSLHKFKESKSLPTENIIDREGYRVVYEDGYVSWSPKEVFEDAYRPTTNLPFSLAVEAIKKGFKVAREGWNGKGMFLFLVPGSTFKVNRPPLLGIYPEGTEVNYCPHIDMRTVDGSIIPWLASQADMLSDDWYIVKDSLV